MTPVSLRIRKTCSSPSQWVRGIVLDRGKLESLPVIVREYQSMAKSLALAEMRLIMAKMLWNFDMECQTDEDWTNQKSYMLWEKVPLMMKLVPVRRVIDHD